MRELCRLEELDAVLEEHLWRQLALNLDRDGVCIGPSHGPDEGFASTSLNLDFGAGCLQVLQEDLVTNQLLAARGLFAAALAILLADGCVVVRLCHIFFRVMS